jgi:hypothetical protein
MRLLHLPTKGMRRSPQRSGMGKTRDPKPSAAWGVGEIQPGDFKPGLPLQIRCSSFEKRPVELSVEVYEVDPLNLGADR